jgi:hypothetical protein
MRCERSKKDGPSRWFFCNGENVADHRNPLIKRRAKKFCTRFYRLNQGTLKEVSPYTEWKSDKDSLLSNCILLQHGGNLGVSQQDFRVGI